MTDPARHVTGGVDTHADCHVAVVVDSATGHVAGTASFDNTAGGYHELLAWMRGHGVVDKVGVEGTGTYGAGLTRHLRRHGIAVVEVDRPDRKTRRLRGKSDPVDAEAAARAALAGVATGTPKTRDGVVEAVRVLEVLYESADKDRTRALNQLLSATLVDLGVVRFGVVGRAWVVTVCDGRGHRLNRGVSRPSRPRMSWWV
ncbi:MAG TPA: transposase [Egibacteraceae bacterium]|nr:transposase [Egibacteraceae bacterium]